MLVSAHHDFMPKRVLGSNRCKAQLEHVGSRHLWPVAFRDSLRLKTLLHSLQILLGGVYAVCWHATLIT